MNDKYIDISQELLKQRIIFIGDEINDDLANYVISQMLYLESQDPDTDIHMYINSPGGVITSGLAIYDTMQYIKPDVSTICMGMAASMASILLTAGAPGKRFILPNATVMIHQPLGGTQGQATDIEIQANRILSLKKLMNSIYAKTTGQSEEVIKKDTERDNYLTAQDALKYGLVDEILGGEYNGK